MDSESRTVKGIKNASVSLFFYGINVLLGFWSRKIFYDYLGSEVLGLDTTASSLLGFLNLAELGIGGAVGYFLYTPMFQKDFLSINKIVALQGWIYRRVAFFIIAASAVMMCFFPWIFSDIQIPLWYAYATFGVMLFGNMLGYFMNYRSCVLNADQKGYKVTKVTSLAGVVFRVLLILLLPVVPCPFILYIGTTLAGHIIGCLWLNHTLHKEYTWLSSVQESGKQLLKEYPEILKKTKQLFIHRISGVIVSHVSPLIMYGFTTLTALAYYGNYMTLIGKAGDLISNAFNGTWAGIGNLIASRDEQRIQAVFWELIDSRLCLSFAFLLVLGLITEPFISVWLSASYLLGKSVLILACFLSFLNINRYTVDGFVNGYGLFSDIWAPGIEAIANFSLSILLGYFWGISGVLGASVITTIGMAYCWKPYFLYTRGFGQNYSLKSFYIHIFARLLLIVVNIAVFGYLEHILKPSGIDSFAKIAIYSVVLGIIIVPIVYLEFYLLTPGTRRFHKRMVTLVSDKFNVTFHRHA